MAFSAVPTEADIQRRQRRTRLARRVLALAAIALLIAVVLHTLGSVAGRKTQAHVATKTVTLIEATKQNDGVHVRASLDAPSPNGTSHELRGVVPTQTWNLTKVLWACYPPNDPDKGELRTPLDPDCVDFIKQHG